MFFKTIFSYFASPPLPFLPHFTPLCVASRFFSLASPHFTPLHLTSPFVCLTSLHFMPLTVASRFFLTRFTSFHATSLHLPFCLPHFTPLHATSLRLLFYLPHLMPLHAASRYFHLTSCHFTSPPILSASLHPTSLCLPFFLPHFVPLHSTSLHLPSFRHTSPHLTSSHPSTRPLHFAGNTSPKKYGFFCKCPIQQTRPPASQPFERFALANLLNICHICKRFGHSKDLTQIFSRIFRMF